MTSAQSDDIFELE
ncbi:unnamed protein product, partial [Rotaria sp. Silwood2]